MKRIFAILLFFSITLTACGGGGGAEAPCIDPLGCVTVGNSEPVVIAVALTLSGPNAPYGVDALRGVELAIAARGDIYNHPIELVQEDELCTAEGGKAAAERILQNPKILGVIGATCSGATKEAAKVLSDGGLVLISPSSTAAALTSPSEHQAGFLRTIYNDQSQAQLVAKFAFEGLGARTMSTIHDGSAYSDGLQAEACRLFEQLGGRCEAQAQISADTTVAEAVKSIAKSKPEAVYIPLYTADAMEAVTEMLSIGMTNTAFIGSDGLLNSEFANKARNAEGMYISGPSTLDIDPAFLDAYRERYGEEPIAVFAAQAYDAAMMLFDAIEASAKTTGRDILFGRANIRAALYATSNYKGLSGVLTCSPLGDCAPPNIIIYQLDAFRFVPIYP